MCMALRLMLIRKEWMGKIFFYFLIPLGIFLFLA